MQKLVAQPSPKILFLFKESSLTESLPRGLFKVFEASQARAQIDLVESIIEFEIHSRQSPCYSC